MYYERMPSSAKRRHLMLARDGIQKGIESTDDHNFIGVASACSGTDIGVICLEVVLAMICGLVGISARVAHVFACEKNPLKRAFLQSQFSPTKMFADAAQLGQRMAWCLQMGKSVIVPWCFVFMAGFSCKSRSQASSTASTNVNCIQRQDTSTETSATWEATLAYIRKALPIIVILENVRGLLSKIDADTLSDAEYICECLRSLGYYAQLYKFDAECFGSRASRLRVYFVGWLIAPGASLLPGPRLQLATSKFAFLESFIHTFCIDSLPVEWFLGLNDDAIAKLMSYVEVEAGPHQREGEKWEAEHMAAFRDKGLAWPAELHEGSPTIKALQQKGILFHTNGLSARQAELLLYCHSVFPFGRKTVQFLDVLPSMGRMFAHDMDKSPWKEVCQTLLSGSSICIRYMDGDHVVVRPLMGIEAMQLIGFHSSYHKMPVAANNSLLVDLSGNAFFGFCCHTDDYGGIDRRGPARLLRAAASEDQRDVRSA